MLLVPLQQGALSVKEARPCDTAMSTLDSINEAADALELLGGGAGAPERQAQDDAKPDDPTALVPRLVEEEDPAPADEVRESESLP